MLKNYLTAALRNLRRQKAFAFINILGMAVGLAGFMIFAQMAGVKLNADKFHEKANRIFCVVQVIPSEGKNIVHTTFTPAPLLLALRNDFPEIRDAVRIMPAGRTPVKYEKDSFYENNIWFVDPSFLEVFSFKLIKGDRNSALKDPSSLVLTEAAAEKYFGEEDPLGKILILQNRQVFTVTGVLENIPRTSSLRFDFIVPMVSLPASSSVLEDWKVSRHTTFVLLEDGVDRKKMELKFGGFLKKYYPESPDSPRAMYLFPFLDFRLKGTEIDSILPSTHPASAAVPPLLGVLLLLVVSINFVNLSTARSMHRAKEIGMRKVVGATRRQLVTQFVGESLLLALAAVPLAVILYEFIHPLLTSFIGSIPQLGYTTQVSNSVWNYPFLIKYVAVAAVLTGLLSGLYPALYLSSFGPAQVLKEGSPAGKKKKKGSKAMIIFQFSLSILFIALAAIMKEQFNHLIKADFGYDRKNLAIVKASGLEKSQLELLKTELSRYPEVLSISASADLPIVWSSDRPAVPQGMSEEEAVSLDAYGVDYDFIEVLGMEMVQGRSFSRETGDSHSWIINEAAARELSLENPVGKQIKIGDQTGTVVGVVKDFLFDDVGFGIPPAVLYLESENLNVMFVKFAAGADFKKVSVRVREKWQVIAPELPYDCQEYDEYFGRLFGLLDRIAIFLGIVGLTVVFFSCLGLLGLSSYVVERRTKEIGIRKVLGASFSRIIWTVARGYVVPVAVANAVGLALISFGWSKILETGLLFITPISPAIYLAVVLITLMTASLAVVSQTWKAARSNPVDALRYE